MIAAVPTPTEFGLEQLTWSLLIGSAVLLVAVAAVRVSMRSGFPTLLLYLGLGLAVGESGLGVSFDSPGLTRVLGYAALILILAEGGLTTKWSGIKDAIAPAAVLSTVGTGVSILVVGVGAWALLDLPWTLALLIGAILSSTDAAAVFSVLRAVPLPRRLSGMLEAESGFNDAPAVLVVTALSLAVVPGGELPPWWQLVALIAVELAGGAAVGLAVGWLGVKTSRLLAGSSSALFSIGVLGLTILAYGVASAVHTSGFLATYLSALVLGNAELPHRASISNLAQAIGSLSQIGLFVLLGLLASPSRLADQAVPALVCGLVLLLLARPLSVLVSLVPFRVPWREQAFLSWAGLRGAVPIVLATVPVTVGDRSLVWIYDLVLVLVTVLTLVQAPALPHVARWLRLSGTVQQVSLNVETTPLERMRAGVLMIEIGHTSRLHGVEVFELRLPKGANVTLIVRDGAGFVPKPSTDLRHGDELLIVTTDEVLEAVRQRVQDVSDHGRLAGW